MAEFDISVIGGDKRTAYMVPFFQENGYKVVCYGIQDMEGKGIRADAYAGSFKEAVEASDIIVGGIPLEKEGILDIRELSRLIRKRHTIFGGVIPEAFRAECRERDITCCDFMRVESIAVFNAIATAEGAILEALKNKQTNIHRSKSLVIGYGRCGKVLSEKLKGMSACVAVCSNSQAELALAEAYGMESVPSGLLMERAGEFEYIYNTAPALVLGEEQLKHVRGDALIVDIASGAGGVDYEAAKALQVNALHCLGLPGKYASKISGRRLADYVMEQLTQ